MPHDDDSDPDVVESVGDDDGDDNDENRPVAAPLHRSSSLFVLRTPLSHARDTPLRDITDQFCHPPSPSPVRVSGLKRTAPRATEPPRRPKKPKSLAYPADPPNWLCSRPSSSLPPSSPLPPSTTNIDPAERLSASARHAYYLGTPTRASDSDPFGFVAVERALRAKRDPYKPPPPPTVAKSPPRSTVLSSASPVFASFSQLDACVPTNNEDIEDLYADEPISAPLHRHEPVAPLLMMSSDYPLMEINATCSQPTFPDPLRTPRKRRHRASPAPNTDADPDDQASDVPSSPSPVKVSVGTGTRTRCRLDTAQPSYTPVPKLTRARTRTAGADMATRKPPATRASRPTRHRIPTPSSTRASTSPRQSTAPPTPVPPRRSTRQAAVGARAKLKGATKTSDGEDGDGTGRMKLRSRSAKTEMTKPASRAKHPPSRSKPSTRTQKTTTAKPARGRPKSSTKNAKSKGKAHPLKNVLDMSDDTREKYEKERRERLDYFKRLEGFQIQKENVYIV